RSPPPGIVFGHGSVCAHEGGADEGRRVYGRGDEPAGVWERHGAARRGWWLDGYAAGREPLHAAPLRGRPGGGGGGGAPGGVGGGGGGGYRTGAGGGRARAERGRGGGGGGAGGPRERWRGRAGGGVGAGTVGQGGRLPARTGRGIEGVRGWASWPREMGGLGARARGADKRSERERGGGGGAGAGGGGTHPPLRGARMGAERRQPGGAS